MTKGNPGKNGFKITTMTVIAVLGMCCTISLYQFSRVTGLESQLMQVQADNQAVVEQLQGQISQLANSMATTTTGSVTDHRGSYLSYLTRKSPPNVPAKRGSEDVDVAKEKARNAPGMTLYGGKGDPAHLGGFTADDKDGQSPPLWIWMMKHLYIKSIVDVGCGKGISTLWFKKHNASVLCVEGSHDAVTQSLLPAEDIVEHDFYAGPYWPEKTYDAAWTVEFTEHIARNYINNYMPIWKKSAIIFATHSYWGGWHHVEVHGDWWWKARFQGHGLVYSKELTLLAQAMSTLSTDNSGMHFHNSLQVYLNPEVMALPEHEHLIGELGCFGQHECQDRKWCECKGADKWPDNLLPAYTAESPYDERILKMQNALTRVLEDHYPSKYYARTQKMMDQRKDAK